MTYAMLQKIGTKLFNYDKYGQGPYRNAYAGEVEWWATPDNEIYIHETNRNDFVHTGRGSNSICIGKVKDVEKLKNDLCAETYVEAAGFEIPVTADYYANIYADVMGGIY